jgi:hypothetical protein
MRVQILFLWLALSAVRSEDNFLFGVATVDQDGNRSPAVYPAPSAK